MVRTVSVCRFLLLAAGFIPVSFFLAAQPPVRTLTGRVVHAETGEPVPFAAVTVTGRTIGTVSNADGRFVFKVPAEYSRDTLLISCVGFRAFTRPIPALDETELRVRLRPATLLLAEVNVTAGPPSAEGILKRAVAGIPANYDTVSVGLTAFYREQTRLDSHPISLIEAVLAIYKASYTRETDKDGLKLIQGRKKAFDRSRYNLPEFLNLSNGARSSLFGDFVKFASDKRNAINPKNYRYYDFRVSRIEGDRETILLTVSPKAGNRRATVSGRLYLDARTLAFIRAEWQMSPAGIELENNREWLKSRLAALVFKLNYKLTGATEVVTYAPVGDKWVLSNVERRYFLRLNSRSRRLTNTNWQIATSLTVTKTGPKNIQPFAENDLSKNEQSMYTLVGDRYDARFWGNYNIQQAVALDTVFQPAPLPAAPSGPAPADFKNPFRTGGTAADDSL